MSYSMSDLLQLVVSEGASDLHIRVGAPPVVPPVEGEIDLEDAHLEHVARHRALDDRVVDPRHRAIEQLVAQQQQVEAPAQQQVDGGQCEAN